MLTLAKVLIMLIRLAAVLAIVFGVLLLPGTNSQFLGFHMWIGFFLTGLVLILAIIALIRGPVGPGLIGIAFAILLPYIGLKQIPLRFGYHLSAIQIVHVLVALITLGIAEMLHGKIKRSQG